MAGGVRTTPKKSTPKPVGGSAASSPSFSGKAPKIAGAATKGKAGKNWNDEVELKFMRDMGSKVDTQLDFGACMDLTDAKKVKELFAQEKIRQAKLQSLLGELSSRASLQVWKMRASDEISAMMAKAKERAQHGFKLAKALGQTSVSHAVDIFDSLNELLKLAI